jgi:hypothetical protein
MTDHGRNLRIAALLGAIAGVGPVPCAEAQGVQRHDPADVLAEARSALERGDGRRAVDLLEPALLDAGTGQRKAILSLLDRAYEAAATQAERAGQGRAAEHFRTHLEILRHRPIGNDRSVTQPVSSVARTPEVPAVPLAAPPAIAGRADPQERPPPPVRLDLAPAPGRSIEPSVGVAPAAEPSTSRATPGPPAASGPEPGDGQVVRVSGPVVKAEPFPEPADPDASPEAPAAREATASLARADSAFRARRYDEAGVTYAALYRAGNLPSDHRDVWAYCRRYAVVRRIQSQPRSQAEWDAIRREIAAIRELSPRHWYDEYLLNRVNELSAGGHPPR